MTIMKSGLHKARVSYDAPYGSKKRSNGGDERWTPTRLLIAANAIAALIFLPSVAGDAGRRGGLEFYGLIIGLVMAYLVVKSVANGDLSKLIPRGHDGLTRAVQALAVVGVLSALVGVARGNGFRLILGDVFEIAAGVLAFSFARRAVLDGATIPPIVRWSVGWLLLQHVRDLVAVSNVLIAGYATRLHAVLWPQQAVGAIGAMFLASDASGAYRSWMWASASAGALVVGSASGFRSYVAVVLIALITVPLLRPMFFLRSYGHRAVVGGLLVAAALSLVLTTSEAGNAVLRALQGAGERATSLTHSIESEQSAYGRVIEIRVVKDELAADPMATLLGLGAGATWELPLYASPFTAARYRESNYQIHYVHNNAAAFAFRGGLMGLIVFVWLAATGLRASVRSVRRAPSLTHAFPGVVVICFLSISPFFTFIPGDIIFFTMVGVVSVHGARHKKRLRT